MFVKQTAPNPDSQPNVTPTKTHKNIHNAA